VNVDLQQAQAESAARAALRPDPGTTVRPDTRRKGTVTQATVGKVACQVDGLPATNTTGWNLTVGERVWVSVNQGRRFVTGLTVIKGS
jgi:hypothetical protein